MPDHHTSAASQDPRFDPARQIHAPTGTQLSCKNWVAEAAYRMIQNNLDPAVAENAQVDPCRTGAVEDRLLGAFKDVLKDNDLPPAVRQEVTQWLPEVQECHSVMRDRKHAMKAA